MQNSFLAILLAMLISQNQSKEEELVKNAVFSLLAGRHQRVKESYQFVSNWPFSSQKSQICPLQHKTVL